MGGLGKRGELQAGFISQDIDISSLGANSVASVQVGDTLTQMFRLSRMVGWVAGDALTADVGPIIFGIASAGLTITEIDEALSALASAKQDIPDVDRMNRPVFPLAAVFSSGEDGVSLSRFDTKEQPFPGMSLPEANPMFNMFAWNADQVTVMGVTTGINFFFKFWGVWI